jgi:hypothetical protein
MVGNTPGVADGSLTMFLDGAKISEYTGIMFTATGGNSVWQQLNWNPTWGGLGGTVTADMYLWMDHIYLSGK